MKKVLALLLCLVTVAAVFAGCSQQSDSNDNGAIINAYIASETFSLDPAYMTTDDDAGKILGLLYEGLTRINSNGKLEYAMLDSYSVNKDEIRNEYKLTLKLNKTRWSDGIYVTASDYVYAWRRILSSDFSCPAASLLYDIKNAREVKSGDKSIDDIGIAAVDTYTIEVTFTEDVDYQQFLYNCASVNLVPLRENIVSKSEENWSKKATAFVSCGPFKVTKLDFDANILTLDRNPYYYTKEDETNKMKYVTPYRLVINFTKDTTEKLASGQKYPEDLDAQLAAYLNGEIFYLGDLSLANRTVYKNDVTVTDKASELACIMNFDNKLFADENVRRALSLAVDRNAIAQLLVFAKPATGIITYKVFDGITTKSFRDTAGTLISSTADTAQAKSLLSTAGVKGGSFTITCKNTEADKAVAEYLKGVWQELGFTVTVKAVLGTKQTVTLEEIESLFVTDDLTKAYQDRDFDVLLMDYSMMSSNAFGVLASFSKEFSGMACDQSNDWALVPNVTGFDDAAYTEIIERAFAEKNSANRAVILHEAEAYLVDKMPIIPLVFNQDFYLASKELSGIKTDWFGIKDFRKLTLKNYQSYITTEAE